MPTMTLRRIRPTECPGQELTFTQSSTSQPHAERCLAASNLCLDQVQVSCSGAERSQWTMERDQHGMHSVDVIEFLLLADSTESGSGGHSEDLQDVRCEIAK